MKVTKTIEITFPWQLEADDHGSTVIYALQNSDGLTGEYNYENRYNNGKLCDQKIMTKQEVQKLIDTCYQVTRRTDV